MIDEKTEKEIIDTLELVDVILDGVTGSCHNPTECIKAVQDLLAKLGQSKKE